jgi:hypothetical protein
MMMTTAESSVIPKLKQLLTEAKQDDLFRGSAFQICIDC